MNGKINLVTFIPKAEAGWFMEQVVDLIRGEDFDEKRMEMAIAFEEAFMNVATHAYPEGEGPVAITLNIDNDKIVVVLDDCGIPYDPTIVEVPDMTDEFQVGGHGIRLMQNYCNLEYIRAFDHNLLRLTSK